MALPELGPLRTQVATASGTTVSHTTPATASTLMTTNQQFWQLAVFNSCDKGVALAFNGVETFRIGTGSQLLNLADNGIFIPKGTVISAYNLGSTPTVGELSITGIGRDMTNYG